MALTSPLGLAQNNRAHSEVHLMLKGTKNTSALGPSGVGYQLLKWVHFACPDYLPHLFNLCIDTGIHLWKLATVVMVNKP